MADPITTLQDEKYINVETFKKDGNGVKTPVWFVEMDGRIVLGADGNSYKAKRVRRNPKARFAACGIRGGVHGAWFDAAAQIVEDEPLRQRTFDALSKKYGFIGSIQTVGAKLSGSFTRRTVIALQPA